MFLDLFLVTKNKDASVFTYLDYLDSTRVDGLYVWNLRFFLGFL